MLARIYKPARNAMQSGQANTKEWVLEFEPEEARRIDPLMGWTGSGDMKGQVRLTFETRDEAVAYAERYRIPTKFSIRKSQTVGRAYADNFKYTRRGQWTH
jgi:hypothetical protein